MKSKKGIYARLQKQLTTKKTSMVRKKTIELKIAQQRIKELEMKSKLKAKANKVSIL